MNLHDMSEIYIWPDGERQQFTEMSEHDKAVLDRTWFYVLDEEEHHRVREQGVSLDASRDVARFHAPAISTADLCDVRDRFRGKR